MEREDTLLSVHSEISVTSSYQSKLTALEFSDTSDFDEDPSSFSLSTAQLTKRWIQAPS